MKLHTTYSAGYFDLKKLDVKFSRVYIRYKDSHFPISPSALFNY